MKIITTAIGVVAFFVAYAGLSGAAFVPVTVDKYLDCKSQERAFNSTL